jgi:hypothetical protein
LHEIGPLLKCAAGKVNQYGAAALADEAGQVLLPLGTGHGWIIVLEMHHDRRESMQLWRPQEFQVFDDVNAES